MSFTLKEEFYRKLVHLSSIIYPIFFLFVNETTMLYTVMTVFLLVLGWDTIRIRLQSTKKNLPFIFKMFNKFLRDKELNSAKFSGATFFMLSLLLVVLISSKIIAILSMLILIFCDTIAALIGKKYGKIRILDKSLEGLLAFILLGIVIVYMYLYALNISYNAYQYSILILAVVVSGLAELIANKIKIDDNLLITLSFAIVANFIY